MPVIKSAKKKLRQDKKRTVRNAKKEDALKDAIKAAKKSPTLATVKKATSLTDKAAKKHILHKNKAARIKSALSKLIGGGKGETASAKVTAKSEKKVVRKAAPKKK